MTDQIDEALTLAQRQRRALIMHRYANKLERAREIAKKKLASNEIIKKRAYAKARAIFRTKIAGEKGAHYEDLTASEKIAIDKMLDTRKKAIWKLATRLIPKIKQEEAKRLQSFMSGAPLKNHGQPEGMNTAESEPKKIQEEVKEDPKSKKDDKKKKQSGSPIIMYKSFSEEADDESPIADEIFEISKQLNVEFESLGEVYDDALENYNEDSELSREEYALSCVRSLLDEEELTEKRGLWDNIHAKRRRIKNGSGERMRKPGSKGAPSAQDFKDASKTVKEDVFSSDKEPVYVPPERKTDGTYTKAKTVLKRRRKKIIDAQDLY